MFDVVKSCVSHLDRMGRWWEYGVPNTLGIIMKKQLLKIFSSLFLQTNDTVDYFINDSSVVCKKRNGTIVKGFSWPEVEQVEVYKIDLLTYDELALLFKTSTTKFEILESHSAFQFFRDQLHDVFEVDESWYFDAMKVPFKTNHKVLFKI